MAEVEPLDSHEFIDDGICPACMEKTFNGYHRITELLSFALESSEEAVILAQQSAEHAYGIQDIAVYLWRKTWQKQD